VVGDRELAGLEGPGAPDVRPHHERSHGPVRAAQRCRHPPQATASRPPCRRAAGACGHPRVGHGPEAGRAAGRPLSGWPPGLTGPQPLAPGGPGHRPAPPATGRQGWRVRAHVGQRDAGGPGPRGPPAPVAPPHSSTSLPRASVVPRRDGRYDGSRPASTPPADGPGVATLIVQEGLGWSSFHVWRRFSSRLWALPTLQALGTIAGVRDIRIVDSTEAVEDAGLLTTTFGR
jgi:hypothetical protein